MVLRDGLPVRPKGGALPFSGNGITVEQVPHMISHPSDDFKERRSGTDRRQFSYAAHIPERRSGKERRKPNPDRVRVRSGK